MHPRQALKDRSVFFTWLSSYIIILLIPIVMSGAVYVQTKGVIEEEINQSNTFLLSKARQQMDSVLEDVDRLSMEIALNPRVMELGNFPDEPSDLDYYRLTKTVEDLKSYKVVNSAIESFFVFFNGDRILTNSASYAPRTYYDQFVSMQGISFSGWIDIIRDRYNGGYAVVPNKGQNERNSSNTILHIRAVPGISVRGEKAVNIITTINGLKLIGDINEFAEMHKGSILILDKNNQVVSSTQGEIPLNRINLNEMDKDRGIFHQSLGKQPVVIAYETSNITGWKFLAVTPSEVFWKRPGTRGIWHY